MDVGGGSFQLSEDSWWMTDDPVIGMDAVLKSDVFCTLSSGTEVAGCTVAGIFKGMHSLDVSPGGGGGKGII